MGDHGVELGVWRTVLQKGLVIYSHSHCSVLFLVFIVEMPLVRIMIKSPLFHILYVLILFHFGTVYNTQSLRWVSQALP